MKKLLSYLGLILILSMVLTACSKNAGPKESSQAAEQTIQFHRDPDKAKLIKTADDSKAWDEIFAYWDEVSESGFVNTSAVPAGLPEDDSLCIVVLGFQLNMDGSMKDELVERLKAALKFATEYENAYVLVTGGPTAQDNKAVTEAGEMAKWLVANGLSSDRILVEEHAMTTVQNAILGTKLIRQLPQIKQIAVVTSDYHVPLGSLLFNAMFILDKADGLPELTVSGNLANKTLGKVHIDLKQQAKWLDTFAAERNKFLGDYAALFPQQSSDNQAKESTGSAEDSTQVSSVAAESVKKKYPKDVSEDDRFLIVEMIHDTDYAEINEEMLAQLEDEDLKEAVRDMFSFWDDAIYEDYPDSDFVPEGLPDDGSMLIVVMGLELYPDGSMKDELYERLNMAIEAAEAYPKSKILVTGGGTAEDNPSVTEAKAMREYLISCGIEKRRIMTEDRAFNSAENAVYSLSLIKDKCPEVKGIMMVTSDYHAPWANLLFKSLFNYEKKLGGEDYEIFGGAYYGAPFAAEEFPPYIQQWLLESLVWNR